MQRFRGKAMRYTMVSVFGTVSTQLSLGFTHGMLDWSGVAANVFSVTITSIPSYFLSR